MKIPMKKCRTEASDRSLLAGFIIPGIELSHSERKIAAGRLCARMLAVEAWVSTGERLSHHELAQLLGISDRCLSYQFRDQSGLFAFPPPELALSMAGASINDVCRADIARSFLPVFVALDANPHGRDLLSGLVRLHRAHPDLADTDGYFAHALRDAIKGKRQRTSLAITGLFTEGLRTAFEDLTWANQAWISSLNESHCCSPDLFNPPSKL